LTSVRLKDGTEVWVRQVGAGPPVVQIHGSAFGHENFSRLTPELTRQLSVIDFDLPGFGASPRPARPRDLDGFADDVAALIAVLGFNRAHVHGTSMGALIALSLAARHPQVVDHLVLSCFLARYDAAARVMRRTWREAARSSGMAAVAELTAVAGFSRTFFEREDAEAEVARMREAFARSDPSAFLSATEALEPMDFSPLADAVRAPTLLIGGEQDAMTPVRPADSGVGLEEIHRRIASCEMVVVPDCGHYLVIEQPAAVAAAVIHFLVGA
jgi:3-oxoadipate enol-lactonase